MQGPRGHLRILSVCWAAYGIICLATAYLLLLYSDTATMMFGTLASRVGDEDALLAIFHVVFTVIVTLSVTCGILGLLAAATLPRRKPIGRRLALAAGFLSLSRIPLGITLGVYTLVVLLPRDSLSSENSSPDKPD